MISRRDFFKMLGIGALGAFVPTKGLEALERNMVMNIGDLFVKLADGTPLTQEEKQQLRLYGNQTQLNNSFVAGLQDGQSSINVRNIDAQAAYFKRPVNKASLYTTVLDISASNFQEVPANTLTVLDDVWGFSYEDSDSVVRALDLSAGKFRVNPLYSGNSKFTFSFFGNVNFYSGLTSSLYSEAYILFKRKSDDVTVLTYSLYFGRSSNIPIAGNYTFSTDVAEKIEDLYFQIAVKCDNGSATKFNTQADVLFFIAY